MPSVKDLNVTYNVLNKENNFSGGDPVTGRVTFQLEKELKVKSVIIKLKGDANVRWTTGSGDHRRTYHAHRRYFKLKTYLVPETADETVLSEGPHAYNFSFKIPMDNMPPSYKGVHGRIVYVLQAKVSRSWRPNSVSTHELTFVNRFLPAYATVGSVEKELGTFHKGKVKMEASVDKGTCCPGERMTVVAKVNNSSSKKMTPKFKMVQKVVYRAQGHTNWSSREVCKGVGNLIEAKKDETITCQMEIPAGWCPTISNCDIISLQYIVKAYLDISFAFDPKVEFQVLMLPAGMTSGSIPPPFGAGGPAPYQPQGFGGPAPYQQPQGFGGPTPYQQPQGFGGPTHSDFPPPYQQPQGFGGPIPNSGFPPPVAPAGLYPAVPPAGPGGVHGYPAAPGPGTNNFPGYPSNPPAYADLQNGPSISKPGHGPYSSNPLPQQTPGQPGFSMYPHLPPSAPPVFNPSPSAPTFNIDPTAPAMSSNFLSEQKEPPPSYNMPKV